MNKSNAHLYLPLVQALVEGKTIQVFMQDRQTQWQDAIDTNFGLEPDRYRIKPLDWPPIPDGCSLHNPDNLTPEQVGDGYRLLVSGEVMPTGYEYFEKRDKTWSDRGIFHGEKVPDKNWFSSVRVPIQTPFPDGSRIVDGKLVKPWVPKFKVGDRISIESIGGRIGIISEILPHRCYKVEGDAGHWSEEAVKLAPWTLSSHIPPFRPLRDGEEWHFTADEWKEGDLEEGWRPVLRGEQYKTGDMKWCAGFGPWSRCEEDGPDGGLVHGHTRFKTCRPLPEPKKRVPLGPSDIRPGNVFRYKNMREGLWAAPSEVGHDGLLFWSYKEYGTEGESYHVSWEKLMSYERSNDGINWTPCYREE